MPSIHKQSYRKGSRGILDSIAKRLNSEGIHWEAIRNRKGVVAIDTHSAIFVGKSYLYQDHILSIDDALISRAIAWNQRIIFLVLPEDPRPGTGWYAVDPHAFRSKGYPNYRGDELFANLSTAHTLRCCNIREAYTGDIPHAATPTISVSWADRSQPREAPDRENPQLHF